MLCAALAEQLPTEVFSAREGLPTTSVERIVADSKGFVWMPLAEGLARFDGGGFRIFTQADGLPAGPALDIFERQDGSYWVTVQDQLCRMDPRPGQRRFQCESPKLGTIQRVLEDERGVWCGAQTGLWLRRRGQTRWEAVEAGGPSPHRSPVVHRLLLDSRGDVWAIIDADLWRFRRNGKKDRWTASDGIEADVATVLAETPGAIWTGSQYWLSRLAVDPHTGNARIVDRFDASHGLPSRYVCDIRLWNGEIWASTFQGLARLLPSGRWQAVELHPNLAGIPQGPMAVDSLGHLWVGTDGGGAARITASGFSRFNDRDGLGVRKVWAILEDAKGDLVAVTKDETRYSLSRFDGYRFHAERPYAPGGIEFGWSWSHIAVHSRSGGWWLGTGAGILRYDRLNAAPVHLGPRNGLPEFGNMRVYEDSHGAMWASLRAVSTNALYRRAPGASQFERLDQSHGLPSLQRDANCPVAFAEDRSGQIWIGMLDGGVVRYREGRFQEFTQSSGAPDQGVRSILVDSRGRLWIGSTHRGILRLDDPAASHPVFRAYTTESGLSGNTISALAVDRTGRIYASTGLGIDRLDPETGRVRAFGSADGVPASEFRVAATDRHGAIWFGGDTGLVRLLPREDPPVKPEVLVYSIRVNGHARLLSDFGDVQPAPLSLGSAERQVQVYFGGFRHDLRYQTLLSGVDAGWTAPSAARNIEYLALPPGDYKLGIRAVSPNGDVSPDPAWVRFRIAAPLWQRWWFLALSASAVAGLVLLAYRIQLERRLAIERVRSTIATDLHDHIGASLSRIAMTTEVMRLQAGTQNPDSGRLLGDIADTARGLVEDMSDIVWSIDPRRDTLGDLVGRLRAFGFGVLEPRGIHWTFEAPEDSLHRGLSPGQRRQLYLILKEALHNIARHSHAVNAVLRIRFEGGDLRAEIEDDGSGYRHDCAKGVGIRSMQARAEQLGGKLEIQPRPQGGTRVDLHFPLSAKDA